MHATSQNAIKTQLFQKRCTLVTDSWTNVNGHAVVNYIAVAPGQQFYLESQCTGGVVHDTEFLVSDVEGLWHNTNT